MKFPTKDKIIITVAVKKKRLQQSRRGLILPDEDTGIIPRRKGGYINFYDLGCFADGSTVPYPVIDAWGTERNDITLAHYQARDEIIFEIPVEDWKTEYKRIDKQRATDYEIVFSTGGGSLNLASDARFTDRGLKLSADWWAVNTHMTQTTPWKQTTEEIIIRDNTATTKVTAEPDFAADAVTPPLSNNMRVYLMPGLKLAQGWAAGEAGYIEEINQFFTIVPREHLVSTGLLYDTSFYGNYTEEGVPGFPSITGYAAALQSIQWQKIVPDARARANGVAMDVEDYGNFAPVPPPDPSKAVFQAYNNFEPPSIRIDGTLRVIIEVGGAFYYFWRT